MIRRENTSPMARVFSKGPEDWGSIPGQVIPKTQEMVLDASQLNTQHHVRIKGKWSNPGKEQHPSLHVSIVAIEKGTFKSPSTTVANYIYIYIHIYTYRERERVKERKREGRRDWEVFCTTFDMFKTFLEVKEVPMPRYISRQIASKHARRIINEVQQKFLPYFKLSLVQCK